MTNKPTLIILAAGLASRYGALKQVDAMGNNGEAIIDFSMYDAYQAGFRRVVFIIRKEHQELFEQQFAHKIRKFMEVEYAFQDINDLPAGYKPPAERVKPWGTVQALLCTKSVIDGPFMVINADDFYGRHTYKLMYDFLTNEVNDKLFAMIGFSISKTVTESGSVTRALCQVEDDYLTKIVETPKITKENGHMYEIKEDGQKIEIFDGPCSMNIWGCTPAVYDFLAKEFELFLKEKINVEKSELVLPTSFGEMIKKTDVKIKVINTDEKWFGITYQQDKDDCRANIQKLKDQNVYPFDLWK